MDFGWAGTYLRRTMFGSYFRVRCSPVLANTLYSFDYGVRDNSLKRLTIRRNASLQTSRRIRGLMADSSGS